MTTPVLSALAALPARLAGSELHVAFTVVVDFDGQLDRTGKPHPVTAYTPAERGEELRQRRTAPWSYADLGAVVEYLSELGHAIRFNRANCLAAAHDLARERIAIHAENRMKYEMKRQADALERSRTHPHQCTCGKHYKTERGITNHVTNAKFGRHERRGVA